jgi:hypothetical protein
MADLYSPYVVRCVSGEGLDDTYNLFLDAWRGKWWIGVVGVFYTGKIQGGQDHVFQF